MFHRFTDFSYHSPPWIRIGIILIFTVICGISCTENHHSNTGQSIQLATGDASWTYMVYMAGDNNLASAAFQDINEMEKIGSSKNINIVVQVEFSPLYNDDYTDSTNTQRGRILIDSITKKISSPLTDIGNKNMGKKTTLTEFINWAAKTYPADNYALVLWSHGAGWKSDGNSGGGIKGALEDSTSNSLMDLPDMADAIAESDVYIHVIDFDACLMGMYEVAYEFNGLTDYLVFSEEVEPEWGNPYDDILDTLTDNPEMTAKELAGTTVSLFKKSYEEEGETFITKSAVDMQYIDEFHENIKALVIVLNENMTFERSNIQRARDASVSYDYPENHDIKNFLDYLEIYTENEDILTRVSSLTSIISGGLISANAVYSPNSNDPILNSSGLAIYLPNRDQISASESDLLLYERLAINKNKSTENNSWGAFINMLITGDSTTGDTYSKTEGNFIIKLTWDTDADVDLIIKEPDGTFAAPYIDDTTANGFLSQDSVFVDFAGDPYESYAAAETVERGNYEIYGRLYKKGDAGDNETHAKIYLLDPERGIDSFQLIAEKSLNLSDPAPADWIKEESEVKKVQTGSYSNCWLFYTLDRNTNEDLF